jgi:lipoprotein-releasing system ATP-binding protein
MIQIENLTKSFGDLQVLKGVNLTIEKGEVISIIGSSGAGKTTLLQLIGTLDKPTGGTIRFNGEDLGRLNSKRLAAFRNSYIGFVFQFHQLLPEFTALENIVIPALIAGRKRSEAEAEAMQLLQVMGLEERAHHKPAEMSGGENQRVAVARALINHPDVVLADEPSGSLDSKNKEELHKLFSDLRDRYGQTFVIVTHDETLASYTDRTLHMVDGVIENEFVKQS